MNTERNSKAIYQDSKTSTQSNLPGVNGSDPGAHSDENKISGVDLNEQLITNKFATFFMRVSCNAMEAAGIYQNDVIIVDRSVKAVSGKVIIAVLNGDMLIRRLEKTSKSTRLLADADKLSPISIDPLCEDFSIWGVVTYVIHTP